MATDEPVTADDVRQTLLNQINEAARLTTSTDALLVLAQAFAVTVETKSVRSGFSTAYSGSSKTESS
ncbi:MAG: hypothetical protein WAM97_17600 [Acidimicrobiales bacterium]|jgi:hypothetical protein